MKQLNRFANFLLIRVFLLRESKQVLVSLLVKKSRMPELAIWVFKTVGYKAGLKVIPCLMSSVDRTPGFEVGTKVHRSVWRRPDQSNNVRCPSNKLK